MRLKLNIQDIRTGNSRIDDIDAELIKIGSSPNSHIKIDQSGVARMHAVIEKDGNDIFIMDLGNEIQTKVNGSVINKSSIIPGDVITIGDTEITVYNENKNHEVNIKENYTKCVKVYLAGPDVFKPDVKEISERLKKECKIFGFEGHFPLDNELVLHGNKYNHGRQIAIANMKMIRDCDIVLANLEPFRGPSADVGTVWECAYAFGLGKSVYGYNIKSHYKDKVIGKVPHDGMMVEDFESFDNIMLVHSLKYYSHLILDVLHRMQLDLLNLNHIGKL